MGKKTDGKVQKKVRGGERSHQKHPPQLPLFGETGVEKLVQKFR